MKPNYSPKEMVVMNNFYDFLQQQYASFHFQQQLA